MLSHWNPWKAFHRDFNHFAPRRARRPESSQDWRPAVDIAEEESRYLVSLDLPGLTKQDITIRLEESVLTVEGERTDKRELESDQLTYSERRFGTFKRTFTLSRDVNADGIEALFENGVLTLVLPKREDAQSKQIAIN